MENQKQRNDSDNSKMEKPNSTSSIWTEKALLRRLAKGPEARAKFVESQINHGIAFQIRALRNREEWSQPKMAERCNTAQNQIYRLENPTKAKPTISTLKKLAAIFDVGLVVRFVPFSQMVAWASGTPYMDRGLSTASLAVPSFAQEYAAEVAELGPVPSRLEGREVIQKDEQHPAGPMPITQESPALANAAD